jgi:ATP-binding cassette, subfamily B, bacterial
MNRRLRPRLRPRLRFRLRPRPASRRRYARLARILFFDGFRAAPGWMAIVTALLILGSVAGTCYPLGYRLLVDGALAGDAATTAEGVAVVAVLLGLGWVLTAIGATEAMALSDRIAVYRTSKLIELISGVPGLEHLERPDYLAEVERLNAGRRQLRLVGRPHHRAARAARLGVAVAAAAPGDGRAAADRRPRGEADHQAVRG